MNQRKLFSKYLAPTSHYPLGLEVKKAKGEFITATNDEEYYDLISGISVCSLGHNHPEIIKAAKAQLDEHMHVMVYGEYLQKPQDLLGETLASLLPDSLNSSYFMTSGTEAIDAAMKLAKRVTKKTSFVAHTMAYHGTGQGPMSLMSSEYYTDKYRPLISQTYFIEQNDIQGLEEIPWNEIAGVVVEIVQAEKGAIPCSIGYLKRLRELCDMHCTLLIFDEIQTGIGRCGSMFAFEQYDVIPDILVLGKALGGGMPMSAMVSSRQMMDTFADFPVLGHISTFGGHPVSCAASKKALELTVGVLALEDIIKKETLFKQLLKHDKIEKVTGKGLLLAVHYKSSDVCLSVLKGLLEEKILSDWFLNAPHCLRIAPPLNITKQRIEMICQKILDVTSHIN